MLYTILTFAPQRPSHILTVYRPSDASKKLIAKKVREESNELEILKFLNTIQPKSKHVITLLDSLHTPSSLWAILPKMDSVADYLAIAPDQLASKVVQVCWGLIEGLAYLHKHCIAHRDIKPDNLLVDRDFCLKIIDFDIAIVR
jgi:serine/threonine protein kinase